DLCLLERQDAINLLNREGEDQNGDGQPDDLTEEYLNKSLPLHEVAADGLAYGFKWSRKHIDLYPGYRSDLLIKIDQPGDYVLIDLEAPAGESLLNQYETPKLVAVVRVDGQQGVGSPMPLPSDERLRSLRPHRSITDAEVYETVDDQRRLRLQ